MTEVKETTVDNNRSLTIQEADILLALQGQGCTTQRALAEAAGYSLGAVNNSLNGLLKKGYLNDSRDITDAAKKVMEERAPRNAIILAAGMGMRMVPINQSFPKAFVEIEGERLIERQIKQLREAGVYDITIVVGFMKDSFEYLIDKYGVALVYNQDYAIKNNLYSLRSVLDRLGNTYIVPCDIWCAENPFSMREMYSWYMVSTQQDTDSAVRVNRKKELVRVAEHACGNKMIGISYLMKPEADRIAGQIEKMTAEGRHEGDFWEAALFDGDRMFVNARVASEEDVVEINTYEQLRELDADSSQLQSDAIRSIMRALECRHDEIKDIAVLKKGMTNRSFIFTVRGDKYIMRIPGEGTNRLIDRKQEADVFKAISGLGLCDDPVYIKPEKGYKITKYLEGIRACDPESESDLQRCMKKLRRFHSLKLKVDHEFDLFGHIEFYETLWHGAPSIYQDYRTTKENVMSLRRYIEEADKDWCLTHIDAVPDNFLFYRTEDSTEEHLQLTDWEYSGMQDPHVDLAMFCIYSLYDREQCDHLIDIYFENRCDRSTRVKIYCYIAVCGLLWSNWCEFKRQLGVEFGEYSLRQYHYAKEFYRYAKELMA